MKSIFFTSVAWLALFTLGFGQTALPRLPELQFAEIQAKGKFLGDRWSYMEAGPTNAPVIVTLHGRGDNSMAWRFQLAGLSDRFRVIAWNAPGYMLSDGFKTDTPGCQDYADALADFLDALKLTRVHLLGNSFGSRIAQCFAMSHPTRVNKIAFVGPSAGRKDMPEADKAATRKMIGEMFATGGNSFAAQRLGALLGPNATPQLMELVRNNMRATNPRAAMQCTEFSFMNGYSPAEVAAKVSAPILLIVGSEDRVSPLEKNGAPLKKALPNARLEVLQGIGHLPHLEAPDKVNQLVREFFRR